MLQASPLINEQLKDMKVEPEIERRYKALVDICHENIKTVDDDLLRRAFHLAYWAHRHDRRKSGELYITHPLEVATIVARDIRLDDVSVAAALLHDVVEDTELTLGLIKDEFGETMAKIIDGLTKIRDVFKSGDKGKAESTRKLLLSMASDLRVILVKFADRLHNMRTLGAMPRNKQIRIASETRDMYAPLAHRFGLNAIKSEFEDLSLRVLDAKMYYEISRGLKSTKRQREKFVQSFIGPLAELLREHYFSFEIYGRPKHIYSIYRKMKRQNKGLADIYDLFAIRIVLNSEGRQGKEDCWRVYSIITDLYKPLPERFRDLISVPKSNGYQSLHTTVLGPEGKPVEVQIRTLGMHLVAEMGVAAHWKYKEGASKGKGDQTLEQSLTWVRDLLENPQGEGAKEFVRDFQLNLYHTEIYVFTPKGDLMTLPEKATPVDFAFQVHTEVGLHTIGAKVNGKMVPLSYKLESGDQVEVLTSKKQSPNPDWIQFVITQKARSRIRNWINEKRRKIIEEGRTIWEKRIKRAKLQVDEQDLHRYSSKLKFPNVSQMFYEIGEGLFDVRDLLVLARKVTSSAQTEPEKEASAAILQFETPATSGRHNRKPSLLINGEQQRDIMTQYASCCNPIPGDEVFGHISKSGSIKIHRLTCKNAPYLLVNHAERILKIEWSRQKDVQFVSTLRVIGEDRVGLLSDLTTIISKNLKTNIQSLSVQSVDGVFEGKVVMQVTDLEHLKKLMARIKKIDGIHGVYRKEE